MIDLIMNDPLIVAIERAAMWTHEFMFWVSVGLTIIITPAALTALYLKYQELRWGKKP